MYSSGVTKYLKCIPETSVYSSIGVGEGSLSSGVGENLKTLRGLVSSTAVSSFLRALWSEPAWGIQVDNAAQSHYSHMWSCMAWSCTVNHCHSYVPTPMHVTPMHVTTLYQFLYRPAESHSLGVILIPGSLNYVSFMGISPLALSAGCKYMHQLGQGKAAACSLRSSM